MSLSGMEIGRNVSSKGTELGRADTTGVVSLEDKFTAIFHMQLRTISLSCVLRHVPVTIVVWPSHRDF